MEEWEGGWSPGGNVEVLRAKLGGARRGCTLWAQGRGTGCVLACGRLLHVLFPISASSLPVGFVHNHITQGQGYCAHWGTRSHLTFWQRICKLFYFLAAKCIDKTACCTVLSSLLKCPQVRRKAVTKLV